MDVVETAITEQHKNNDMKRTPGQMNLWKMFWAEQGEYEPCGMFCMQHGIILLLCICVLIVLILLSNNLSRENVMLLVRCNAVCCLLFELVKIYYNLSFGYYWLDAWLPVAFCSIFLYALWMSGFGKGWMKRMGDAYLSGVAIIAGMAYLIFPTTSLMLYPAWHFLSLHSMLFHTFMIYFGYLFLHRLHVPLNMKMYLSYCVLYGLFLVISLLLNHKYNSNLMLLREPFHIPFPFLHQLYQTVPWAYTLFVMIVYLFVPYGTTTFIINKIRKIT